MVNNSLQAKLTLLTNKEFKILQAIYHLHKQTYPEIEHFHIVDRLYIEDEYWGDYEFCANSVRSILGNLRKKGLVMKTKKQSKVYFIDIVEWSLNKNVEKELSKTLK